MNTLYLLSGPPRAAKTTIMNSLIAQTKVQLIAGDALEHGIRNILTGEPHQLLERVEFSGTAEFKTSIAELGGRKSFSTSGTESELLLQTIIGMLDYYRRNKESVAFEGTEFSPAWVAGLELPDFTIRAAYVGYTADSQIDPILTHAKQNEHDWINDWLQAEGGDDTKIRAWVQSCAAECKQLKLEAELHGFPFFDLSTQPFEEYKAAVLTYFLEA